MKIDTDKPLPDARPFAGRKRGGNKYPFREMAIGDSCFFPHAVGPITKCAAYMAAATLTKRYGSPLFSGRTVVEEGQRGVRVWRIE